MSKPTGAPDLGAFEVTIGGTSYVLAELDTHAARMYQRAITKAQRDGKPDEGQIEGLRLSLRKIGGRDVDYASLAGTDWLPKRGVHYLQLCGAFDRVCMEVEGDDPFATLTAISGG
jgi:hypothetical protein